MRVTRASGARRGLNQGLVRRAVARSSIAAPSRPERALDHAAVEGEQGVARACGSRLVRPGHRLGGAAVRHQRPGVGVLRRRRGPGPQRGFGEPEGLGGVAAVGGEQRGLGGERHAVRRVQRGHGREGGVGAAGVAGAPHRLEELARRGEVPRGDRPAPTDGEPRRRARGRPADGVGSHGGARAASSVSGRVLGSGIGCGGSRRARRAGRRARGGVDQGRRAVDRGGVVGQGGGRHPQRRLGGGLPREEVGVVGVGGAGQPDPPVRLGGVAAREREVGQRRVRLRRLRGGGRGADGPLQRGAGRVDPAERLVEGGRAGEGGDVGPPLKHVPDGDAALVVPTEPARGVGERPPHRGVVRIQRQRAPGQALRLGVPALHGPQRGEPAQRGRVAVRAQLQRTAERGVGVGVAARVAGVRGLPQHERAELRPCGRVLGCGGDAGPERRGLVDVRRGADVAVLAGSPRRPGPPRRAQRGQPAARRTRRRSRRDGAAGEGSPLRAFGGRGRSVRRARRRRCRGAVCRSARAPAPVAPRALSPRALRAPLPLALSVAPRPLSPRGGGADPRRPPRRGLVMSPWGDACPFGRRSMHATRGSRAGRRPLACGVRRGEGRAGRCRCRRWWTP